MENYLKTELYSLIKNDDKIIDFLEEGSLDGLWYWDLENKENEWMSPKFWKTLGVDPKSKKHLAKEWQELIHPDDLKIAISNFEKHCQDPKHKYDQLVRYKHSQGHWITVRCRGLAIRDESGVPFRLLGAHTDVTEIVHAREREKLLKKLNDANEDLRVFAYAASHDLRSPVKSLFGLMGVLKDQLKQPKEDPIHETIKHIDDRLSKLEKLLESVLDFSKIENEVINFTPFSLDHLITEIEEITSSKITKETNLGIINGQKELILRVFSNLVENSLKHSGKKDPEIKISRKDNDDHIIITFRDNGVGISNTQLDKIFQFFSKAHSPTTQKGNGLGLAIVRKIVDIHHGKVWAESKKGEGMTIFISLPNKGNSNE